MTLFSLVGKYLKRGELNLIVMEHTEICQVLLVVVDSFETQMTNGLNVTHKKLEHVTVLENAACLETRFPQSSTRKWLKNFG